MLEFPVLELTVLELTVLEVTVLEVTVEIEGTELLAGMLEVGEATRAGAAPAPGQVTFSYDEGYLRRRGAYPLDPALPLVPGWQRPPGETPLFHAFLDAGPDAWGRQLMQLGEEQRAHTTGATPRRLGPVDFLLATRDELREGALRLRRPSMGGQVSHVASGEGGAAELEQLGRLLRAVDAVLAERGDVETDDADGLSTLIVAGASIGGAQPKAAVRTASGRPGIAKFTPSAHRWDLVGWEQVIYTLARLAGIEVAPSALVEVDGRNVFVVERFDRADGRRIGFASARTMLGADDDEHSYLEIAERLARSSLRPERDLEQMWRRIVFSVLVSNTDEHLRNHAMLRDGAGWVLSPCYDVNPNPESDGRMLTAIGEDDHNASIDLALSTCGAYALSAGRAVEIVHEVERATEHWRQAAIAVGLLEDEIDLMAQAFESEQRSVARRLAGRTT